MVNFTAIAVPRFIRRQAVQNSGQKVNLTTHSAVKRGNIRGKSEKLRNLARIFR